MSKLTPNEQQFIIQVARDVIEELAPGELDAFPLMVEAYEMSPEAALVGGKPREVEMGMGLREAIITWTPLILLMLEHAVIQGGKDSLTEGAKTLFIKAFQKLLPKSRQTPSPEKIHLVPGQELSSADLQKLETLFYEALREFKIKDADAHKIAVYAVGKWVMRSQELHSGDKGGK